MNEILSNLNVNITSLYCIIESDINNNIDLYDIDKIIKLLSLNLERFKTIKNKRLDDLNKIKYYHNDGNKLVEKIVNIENITNEIFNIEYKKDKPIIDKIEPPITNNDIRLFVNSINQFINIQKIDDINLLDDMFKYVKDKNNDGIYCSINGIKIKLRSPEVLDPTKYMSKRYTVRCRYETYKECMNANKYKSSKLFKCNYLHEGNDMVVIGNISKCNKHPNIGNAYTLNNDLNDLNLGDIKTLLTYGLTDVYTSFLWLKRNNINKRDIEYINM